jgi:hypothetical protein
MASTPARKPGKPMNPSLPKKWPTALTAALPPEIEQIDDQEIGYPAHNGGISIGNTAKKPSAGNFCPGRQSADHRTDKKTQNNE